MKIFSLIARLLLGLMFTVFGLNGFFHFLHQPPPPSQMALQFFVALSTSHYLVIVFALQLVAGVLLLAGLFVPLALVMLAPILVNILNYHLLIDPKGIGPGIFATLLWLIVFVRYRENFLPLFEPRIPPSRA